MAKNEDSEETSARGDQRANTEVQLDRARLGDSEGFAGLYERLAPALYGWAALRIHPGMRHKIDPEDLVQEVWWRAMDSFATYDSEKSAFRTWLFKIATNVLIDCFRRQRGGAMSPRDHLRPDLHHRPSQLVAQVTSISRQVARDETVQDMVAAAATLDDADRSLFVHCALEGLRVADAAQLIGVSEAAAAKRWQRLKAKLRESAAWDTMLRTFVADSERA